MKIILSILFVLGLQTSQAKEVEKAKTLPASVDFDSIQENQTFKSPFKVKMKVTGLKLQPAGGDTKDKTSGHHHILINTGPLPAGQPIPVDEHHLHYGKAQTEAEINLAPGDYTLTLQFANGAHISYGPELSKSVKIKVVK